MISDPGQSLCVSCGLCCDGTLFGRLIVSADEDLGAFEYTGIQFVTTEEGKQRIALPCSRFRDGKCQTYDCRPRVCHVFRCALLKRLDRADVAPERALEIVTEAKRLRDRLQQMLAQDFPDLAGNPMRRAVQQLREHAAIRGSGFAREHAPALLAAAAFELHLQRHFLESEVASMEG